MNRLKQELNRLGLTGYKAAQLILKANPDSCINSGHISRWCTGSKFGRNPNFDSLRDLHLIGVDILYVITGERR